MSERMDEMRAELAERERRVREDLPGGFGLLLGSVEAEESAAELLDGMFPADGRRAPWVDVTCGGHVTGARLRLVRSGHGWEGIVHRRSPLSVVHATLEYRNAPEGMGATLPMPDRWQVDCEECGRASRMDPGRLGELVVLALVAWDRGGRRSTVGVSWTSTTTGRSSMGVRPSGT